MTVRTVAARSAEIVPNLTGFSVRACATRQIFANSSGSREADLVVDGVVLPAADDLVQPAADRVVASRTSLGVVLARCRSMRSRGYENHERPADVGVEVVVAVREDVEPGELLVGDHRRDGVHVLLAERDVGHAPSRTAARAGCP